MKYRIKDGRYEVLVRVYLSFGGFVAHWFSHCGKHTFEVLTVRADPATVKV